MYRSAQDGECPLVVDTLTPSCGNSRFGCWVCTVVDRDRSMEAMIDSGEEWLEPLLEFRDWLSTTQDPTIKPQQREFKGRDGRIRTNERGVLWRTFKLEISQETLARLLKAQRNVQAHDPDFELISEDELREIRRLWLAERQDWEDSLPQIYRRIMGQDLDWEQNDVSIPGRLELDLLTEITHDHDLSVKLVQKLLDAEWQYYGMRRRGLIHKTIEKIFAEDWRSLAEVQIALDQQRQAEMAEAA
jgi:DNA sulfur modification protein DndC